LGYLQQRLGANERVWLQPHTHPIAALDASFYWFAFEDLIPFSLSEAARAGSDGFLPPLRDEDLPLCQIERGEPTPLRFVMGDGAFVHLPAQLGCLRRLRERGRIVPTLAPGVLAVKDEREP